MKWRTILECLILFWDYHFWVKSLLNTYLKSSYIAEFWGFPPVPPSATKFVNVDTQIYNPERNNYQLSDTLTSYLLITNGSPLVLWLYIFYCYSCYSLIPSYYKAGSVFLATSCDEEIIPNVTHATYRISKGDVRKDFTYPMTVTYTCDDWYDLLDPDRHVVECEFPGTTQGNRGDGEATPQWGNFSGIICGKFKPVDQITIIKGSAQLHVF